MLVRRNRITSPTSSSTDSYDRLTVTVVTRMLNRLPAGVFDYRTVTLFVCFRDAHGTTIGGNYSSVDDDLRLVLH